MRAALLCIGNELMMDEGVGPVCARYLQSRYEFPENVDVLDRAVMGMAAISDLRDHDLVVVLDAVQVPDARPGQIFSFAPDDIAPTPAGALSLHEMRFADVLTSAELMGIQCAGHCFGIQVENMSPSEFVQALTPRVAAAVPLLAQAAVRYLRSEAGLEIRDVFAEEDPYRAGLKGTEKVRDFSWQGVRSEDGTLDARVCSDAISDIYGEPDTTVMAGYLAEGLRAVGAADVQADEEPSASPRQVSFILPARDKAQRHAIDMLAERFGLEVGDGQDEGVMLHAYISPAMTDYDCDALIGACLEVIEGSYRGQED